MWRSRFIIAAVLSFGFCVQGEEQVWFNWAKSYRFSQTARSEELSLLRPLQDDFLLIGRSIQDSSSLWRLRVRTDGSIVWNRAEPEATELVYDACELADGSFATIGYRNGSSTLTDFAFIFFNSDGTTRSATNFPAGDQVQDAKIIPALDGGWLAAGVTSTFTNQQSLYVIDLFRIDSAGVVRPAGRIEDSFGFKLGLFPTAQGYLLAWNSGGWMVKLLNSALETVSSEELPIWQDSSVLLGDGRLAAASFEQTLAGDFSFLQYRGPAGGLAGQSERASVVNNTRAAAGFTSDVWTAGIGRRPTLLPTVVHFSAGGKILSSTAFEFSKVGSYFSELLPESPNRLKALTAGATLVQLSMDQVPAGTPQILINGQRELSYSLTNRNYLLSILESDPNTRLFYTLDGSTNLNEAIPFAPFSIVELNRSALLRALAVDGNGAVLPSRVIPVDFSPTFTVVLDTPGGGNVVPWSGGLSAPTYLSNAPANVLAYPYPGWQFARWTGDFAGKESQFTFNVRSNVHATAIFSTDLQTNVAGKGTIISDRFARSYQYGEQVRLAAWPDEGSYFVGWNGAPVGNSASVSFTVTEANPSATALFNPLSEGQVALTVIENGNGAVISSIPPGPVPKGARVVLRAIPQAGARFFGWTGDITNSEAEIILDLVKSIRAVASFSDGIRAFYPPVIEMRATRSSDGAPTIQLFTIPTAAVQVEQSTDLRTWSHLGTFSVTNGTLDLPILKTNLEFFRTRLEP